MESKVEHGHTLMRSNIRCRGTAIVCRQFNDNDNRDVMRAAQWNFGCEMPWLGTLSADSRRRGTFATGTNNTTACTFTRIGQDRVGVCPTAHYCPACLHRSVAMPPTTMETATSTSTRNRGRPNNPHIAPHPTMTVVEAAHMASLSSVVTSNTAIPRQTSRRYQRPRCRQVLLRCWTGLSQPK